MSDLISRQAAIDAARDWYEGLICGSFKGLEKRLRALPSAQPERTGHWVEFPNHNAYKCSECGRVIETADGKNNVYRHYPYCHCGAKMLKEGE